VSALDTAIDIRRIRPDEGLLLRDLRVRSLADAPEAFGQRLDDAATRPEAEWHQLARAASRGAQRAWLVAFRAAVPVGLVLGRRRHPGTLLLFSMWVDPAARRHGVGRQLIARLEDWAHAWGARETVLWVYSGNGSAVAFYRALGFAVEEDGADAASGASHGALAMRRSHQSAGGGVGIGLAGR
jgi:GNAT superfamily N-acetyltransferase